MRIRSITCRMIAALLVVVAAASAQSKADRKWLGQWLRADAKAAKKLASTMPGGRRPSIQRITKLLDAGPVFEKAAPGLHHGRTFTAGGETWTYTIALPDGYSPKKRYPVLIDAGHISMKNAPDKAAGNALMNYVRQIDEPIIGVRPRILDRLARDGDKRYFDHAKSVAAAIPAFREMLRTLRREHAIDANRVYITGISAAGYWAWRFGAALAGEIAGIIPVAAVTHQVRYGWPNFRNLSVTILHTRDDPTCKFVFAEQAHEALKKLGGPVDTIYRDAGGHLASFGDVRTAWPAATKAPRPAAPKHVTFHWQRNEECGAVYWLDVEAAKERAFNYPTSSGHVDARVDEETNTIHVQSENAKRITVYIADGLVDLKRPVKIRLNGKTVHTKRIRPDARMMLRVARERGDTTLRYVAAIKLKPR